MLASSLRTVALVLGLTLQASTLLGQQAPAQARPADRGSGLLIGTVVDGATGKPVAGVEVTLSGTAAGVLVKAPASVLTGPDGRFLFAGLVAARYSVSSKKSGYLSGTFGRAPTQAGTGIEMGPGDRKVDLLVRVWRSAVIGGMVTDEAGEPAVGVEVRLFRRQLVGIRPLWSPTSAGAIRTDDRGMFRVPGLAPGSYLVYVPVTQLTMATSVAEQYERMTVTRAPELGQLLREISGSYGAFGIPTPGASGTRQIGDLVVASANALFPGSGLAYATTYYPAATAPAGASAVTVDSGDERIDINLQLRAVSAVTVSGVLTGPDGPIGTTRVSLIPSSMSTMYQDLESAAAVTDASGRFTMFNVPEGTYTLKVLRVPMALASATVSTTMVQSGGGASSFSVSSGPVTQSTDPVLWAEVPLAVGSTDVTGLIVVARRGIRVTGRVEFSGSATPPTEKAMSSISVRIAPADGRNPGLGPVVKVSSTGELTSQGFSTGRYFVTANPPAPSQVWHLQSITHDGVDVSQAPLVLTGADVSDLVVTFTDRTTSMTGTVHDDAGVAAAGVMIAVFPADADIADDEPPNPRRVRTVRSSADGAFNFTTLPPGRYYVTAVPSADEDGWLDPAVRRRLQGAGTRVTVAFGTPVVVAVTLKGER